jgi:hypothetical protein
MYTSDRFIDDQVHGVTGNVRHAFCTRIMNKHLCCFTAECGSLDDHARCCL